MKTKRPTGVQIKDIFVIQGVECLMTLFKVYKFAPGFFMKYESVNIE